MKIPKVSFNKWLKALRSGKYKQTRENLQDENGFCCLGVACDVIVKGNKKGIERDEDGYIAHWFPEDQEKAPKWLKEINEDFANKSKLGTTLSNLNDERGYTFKQIADELEKTYKKNLV